MPQPEGKLPDAIAAVLAQDRLAPPYLRIHDDDFGPLWLVQSPHGRVWAEDPDHAGPPLHLVQWLGLFPPVESAVLELQCFDADTAGDEQELAHWLFGSGHEDEDGSGAPVGRVDPRMRAMLMFQEAQMMGARTTEARNPKYNPLRSLKLRVAAETRARFRQLRDEFAREWGDARRQLAKALEPQGREAEAYGASLARVVVDQDLVQLRCRFGAEEAVFTLSATGPRLHPLAAPGSAAT